MTNRERIKILRELKDWPISTIDEKCDQVTEALNWAIKVCDKYESARVAKKEK